MAVPYSGESVLLEQALRLLTAVEAERDRTDRSRPLCPPYAQFDGDRDARGMSFSGDCVGDGRI